MAAEMITQKELRELFQYDPETGVFKRLVGRSHNAPKGAIAGSQARDSRKPDSFYLRIKINRRLYKAHRLAWLYMTGEFPKDEIDHIDGNSLNNSFANLREATRTQNMQNCRRTNKYGFQGVSPRNSKWVAVLSVNKKPFYLGVYSTPQAAHAAYIKAKRQLHEFNTL